MKRFTEFLCSSNQDMISTKPQKINLFTPKLVVFLVSILCLLQIFSLSSNQKLSTMVHFHTLHIKHVNKSHMHYEDPYMHYPKPDTYDRKVRKHTPVRYFAIISMQRSGSGWFETLLNSHVNISSHGEIFFPVKRRRNMKIIGNIMDKVYNLDWFSSASKNECTSAVGFKWMLNQGILENHKDIVTNFNKRGVTPIFLFRRNLLQRLISILANVHDQNAKQLNGTHKAHVHSKHEAKLLARYKPKINSKLLIANLKETNKTATDALEHFKSTRHIVLYYEDLIINKTKLVDVLDFLNVPRRKLISRHVKIHIKPLRCHVQNWKEVWTALKGTRFEKFLHGY